MSSSSFVSPLRSRLNERVRLPGKPFFQCKRAEAGAPQRGREEEKESASIRSGLHSLMRQSSSKPCRFGTSELGGGKRRQKRGSQLSWATFLHSRVTGCERKLASSSKRLLENKLGRWLPVNSKTMTHSRAVGKAQENRGRQLWGGDNYKNINMIYFARQSSLVANR